MKIASNLFKGKDAQGMVNIKQMHKSKPKIFSYNSETIFIPNMTQSYLFQPTIPMRMLQRENQIENLTLVLKLIQLTTKQMHTRMKVKKQHTSQLQTDKASFKKQA